MAPLTPSQSAFALNYTISRYWEAWPDGRNISRGFTSTILDLASYIMLKDMLDHCAFATSEKA